MTDPNPSERIIYDAPLTVSAATPALRRRDYTRLHRAATVAADPAESALGCYRVSMYTVAEPERLPGLHATLMAAATSLGEFAVGEVVYALTTDRVNAHGALADTVVWRRHVVGVCARCYDLRFEGGIYDGLSPCANPGQAAEEFIDELLHSGRSQEGMTETVEVWIDPEGARWKRNKVWETFAVVGGVATSKGVRNVLDETIE